MYGQQFFGQGILDIGVVHEEEQGLHYVLQGVACRPVVEEGDANIALSPIAVYVRMVDIGLAGDRRGFLWVFLPELYLKKKETKQDYKEGIW